MIRFTNGGDGHAELGHGMESGRATVEDFLDKFGELSTGSPFLAKCLGLLGGRDFTSKKEPEKSFGKRLCATGCCG